MVEMKKIHIMLAGLPGNMATLVGAGILAQDDMALIQHALTEYPGESRFEIPGTGKTLIVEHSTDLDFIPTINNFNPDMIVNYAASKDANFAIIMEDFANICADQYVPFVMGATGVNYANIEKIVTGTQISAVIAPNMAIPIVVVQAMLQFASATFPGAFKGYTLEIIESHQAFKKDTSGTAKAIAQSFRDLGIPFEDKQIVMIRDPRIQAGVLRIPQEDLNGHGYHTYILRSSDGTVEIIITHNVRGRQVYVEGTLRAIRFLAQKMEDGVTGRVFTMNDVLTNNPAHPVA